MRNSKHDVTCKKPVKSTEVIKFSDLEGSDFGRFEAAMLTRQILGRGLVCEKFHKKVWFFYSLIPTGVSLRFRL